MSVGTVQPHHGKIRTWTLPTILGIVLGVVGSMGVVELRPQVAVVPQCAPLKNGQPFSIPFRISNTGYFGFEVVTVHCYFHKMSGMATTQPLKVNVTRGTLHDKTWDNQHLDRGEGKTLTCEIQQLPPIVPTEADMTVVVDYKATWYPTSRGYFRFIGAPGDNWQWLAQPSRDIQKDVDNAVDDAIKNKQ